MNVGGEIGLRQVEHVLFKVDVGGSGIKITGTNIWENEGDVEDTAVQINMLGYGLIF